MIDIREAMSSVLPNTKAPLKKGDNPLKGDGISRAVKAWQNAKPPQDSFTDYIRASSIGYLCPREFVLNYWYPAPNKKFDWKAQMMMDMGTYLHSYLQDILGQMGVLWGKWWPVDGPSYNGFSLCSDALYEELFVEDDKYRFKGHLDGFVCLNRIEAITSNQKEYKKDPRGFRERLDGIEPNLQLLEIKTTGNYGFKKLKETGDIPASYKMQAAIYQKCTGKESTLFWYINRDTMESLVLPYNYEESQWKACARKADYIWRAIKEERLPSGGELCANANDTRAKKCIHCNKCFDSAAEDGIPEQKKVLLDEGRKLLNLEDYV